MTIVAELVVGLAIGAILGLVGAGGAVLAVPAFLYLFGFSPLASTTASLAVVAASATAGAIPRFRLRQVRLRQALVFWALGIAGTLVGSRAAPHIPDLVLVTGFALVMLGAAAAMWRKSRDSEPVTSEPVEGERVDSRSIDLSSAPSVPRPGWLLPVVALGIGLLTGLFGVGGGFLIVPALVLVFGLPFALAAGTSLVVVALNSVTALVFKFDAWGSVDWSVPALVIVGGLVGSVVASRWNVAIPRRILERGFAVLLVLLACWMIVQPLVAPR